MTFELRADEYEGPVITGRGGIQLPDLGAIEAATPPHRAPEEIAHSFMSLLWELNGRSIHQSETLVTRVDGTRMRTAEMVIPAGEALPAVTARAFYIPTDFTSTDSWIGVDREVHTVSIPSQDSVVPETVLSLAVRYNTPQILRAGRWEPNHYRIDHGNYGPVYDRLQIAKRRTHKKMDGSVAYRAERTEYRAVVGELVRSAQFLMSKEDLWDIPGMVD